jgi:lipoprotein NlpI
MRFTLPFLGFLLLCMASGSGWAAEIVSAEDLLKQAEAAWRKGSRTEAIAMCTQVILADGKNLNAWALRGRYYHETRQDAKAVADFDEVIQRDKLAAGIYQLRGWSQFRLGKFEESIADFDKFIAIVPAQAPHHWQRGIACYYAGRFADGKKQFETHQTVNPHDVENAVWHFLCAARLSNVEKARASLIPIEGDSRVPMKQVHELFAGKAKPEDVLKASEEAGTDAASRNDPLFFAHLYLGLYFEAAGDALKAREHILKAATAFKSDHAMGDVARVHAEVLKKRKKAQ